MKKTDAASAAAAQAMPDYVRQQVPEEADMLQRAWRDEDAAREARDMPEYVRQQLLEEVALLDQAWRLFRFMAKALTPKPKT